MPHEIRERRCANCHAYEGRQCMNLVSIRSAAGEVRSPLPWDSCADHRTADEYAAEPLEVAK